MSNFDFLINMNKELFDIGNKLEDDVIDSPRAVPADATLFLETLVKDIYKLSKTKLRSDELPFYQKIDYLYRSGVITYIYKNKMQDAYNLRNKIHRNYKNVTEETKIALELHQRLYYIAKKYFRDFSEIRGYIKIPDYKKPTNREIHFENCIICGNKNNNLNSNMCNNCNSRIENANSIMSLKNTFGDDEIFTKDDLIENGIPESEALSLILELTKNNLIIKKGEYYEINEEECKKFLSNADEYVKIGILLNRFYKNEISAGEVKKTLEYWKGSKGQKPCIEFHRLVNDKIEKNFEKSLLKYEDIKKSVKESSIDSINIKEWLSKQKMDFIDGNINESFIIFNEVLISDYFKLKKRGLDELSIKKQLKITNELLDFWKYHFMADDFFKKTREIKKELIIKALKKGKSLKKALKQAGVSQKEFNKIYELSKRDDDEFYRQFNIQYTQKRQNQLIKYLKEDCLEKAIKKSKISRAEFFEWYFKGEMEYSNFYLKSTELMMDQYLKARRKGYNKNDILRKLTLPREILKSWLKHDDLKLFKDFKVKNSEITSKLLKRGLIINALKEDKSKSEALKAAKITQKEFDELYSNSKKEKSNFHIRFDYEYCENRKRLFTKLLEDNDFYNSIVKAGITQKDFNKWYMQEESAFISNESPTAFYIKTTKLLMDKYLNSRRNGKNKPDSARSVGLSNMAIDKWLRHQEFELYRNFKDDLVKLNIEVITGYFTEAKSKKEIHDDFDISMKSIDSYIDKGRHGIGEYRQIFELYENNVIPKQIDVFLGEMENKPYKRALKNSKLDEKDLKYYYNLGKMGNNKFVSFYNDYLDLKIRLYVSFILSKKSQKIAFKNSRLKKEEYDENMEFIEEKILKGRLDIIYDALMKNKNTTAKLSGASGVSVEELYDWYFMGKDGDRRFIEYSLIFELTIIVPRAFTITNAMKIGISKNKLLKKLKNDIGSVDFKIWQEHDIIGNFESNLASFEEGDISDNVLNVIKKSDMFSSINNGNTKFFDLINKGSNGHVRVSKFSLDAL